MNRSISLMLFLLIVLLVSCSHPSDMEDLGLLDTEFYSFELLMADNGSLAFDVTGKQDDSRILLEYPDFSIPSYILTPRFSTDAVSVEVEGVQQISGISSVDFSHPVTYTLTAGSGMVQQFDVEVALQPGWQDLGSNPVLAALFPSLIKTGFLAELNPFVVCLDNANTLRAYALDMIDWTSWNEFIGGPAGIESFDSSYWNSQLWTVYQTTGPGGNIELQSCIPPNTWSGVSGSTPYNGTAAGLHSFSGSSSYLFAAWIDDSGNSDTPVVWVYDGAVLGQVGSILDDAYGTGITVHAESFKAVFDGGAKLYAACTFKEGSGLIHLFKIDTNSNAWTSVGYETNLPSDEIDRIIIAMFYDSDKQAPVIFTRSRNYSYENTYKITARYYNKLAGVWTNVDYIDPFYIPESDYTSLSISWFENRPSVVFGNGISNWNGEEWVSVGDDNYTSKPSVQSLSRGVLDTYITAFRDDISGDLLVRYYQ